MRMRAPALCLSVLVALATSGCKDKTVAPPTETRRPVAAVPPAKADPVVARIDLSDVHASAVRARLALAGPSKDPKVVVEAMLMAASDALVLRELAGLGHHAKAGETAHAAAERFLAGIWRADDGCPNIEPAALRQAWMASRGRLHHPRRSTIWEGQFVCCTSPDTCVPADAVACKRRMHPHASGLRKRIAQALPAATGLPSGTTVVAMADSPLVQSHGPVVEEAIATLAAQVTELRLRRYTFDHTDEPGFPGAAARATNPEVAGAASAAALGDVLGPVETPWGWSVSVLVAREATRRTSFKAPATQARLRRMVCSERVATERQAYRGRLLKGARLLWQRPAIEAAFGKAVVQALTPDAGDRVPPHVPGATP